MTYNFIHHCLKGEFQEAKQYLIEHPYINIHADDDYAFRSCCHNGHLEIAQWLWSLDENIDIHKKEEDAFRLSCANGHLEVAKWLYSLNQDININSISDYAFRMSCYNRHLKIAIWLCSLCEKYYVKHKNGKFINCKILTENELEEKKNKKQKYELSKENIVINPNMYIEL
jgi:hypothetical protein